MKLSDEKIVAALLANQTNEQAAAELGISESYLYRRMKGEGFSAKYAEAERNIFQACLNMVKRSLVNAIQVMSETMLDETNSPQVRLNAAEAIVRTATRLYKSAGEELIDNMLNGVTSTDMFEQEV